MRKRALVVPSNNLRRFYQKFEDYASQEKLKAVNESQIIEAEFDLKRGRKKNSILASAKRLETLTPIRRLTKQTVQSSSVSRLHAGSISLPTVPDPDQKIRKNFEYNDLNDFQIFVSSLHNCQAVKSELEMNFNACHSQNYPAEVTIGLFYQIESEFNTNFFNKIENFSKKDFFLCISRLTCYLREILRAMKWKKLEDEAVILNYLWQNTVKIIDTGIFEQEIQTEKLIDDVKAKYKKKVEDYKKRIENITNKYAEYEKEFKFKVDELKDYIKRIEEENKELKGKLNEKEGILQDLNDIDKFQVLKDLNQVFWNISEVLEEVIENAEHKKSRIENL